MPDPWDTLPHIVLPLFITVHYHYIYCRITGPFTQWPHYGCYLTICWDQSHYPITHSSGYLYNSDGFSYSLMTWLHITFPPTFPVGPVDSSYLPLHYIHILHADSTLPFVTTFVPFYTQYSTGLVHMHLYTFIYIAVPDRTTHCWPLPPAVTWTPHSHLHRPTRAVPLLITHCGRWFLPPFLLSAVHCYGGTIYRTSCC